MYLVHQFNELSNETFNEKYSYVFQETFVNCYDRNSSLGCKAVLWYLTCLKKTGNSSNAVVQCPFFRNIFTAKCINETWDITLNGIYDNCYIREFLLRSDIARYSILTLGPITLLCFITSIFRIKEFSEINDEFQWQVVSLMLLIFSFSLIMIICVTLINEVAFVAVVCTFFIMILIYAELFIVFSFFNVCFYLFSLIHYINTQLRIIRSALNHATIVGPVVSLIICLVIGTDYKNHSYHMCISEPILSSNFVVVFYVTTIIYLMMISLRFKLKFLFRNIDLNKKIKKIYRVEYDILGQREEISYHDLYRLFFMQDVVIIAATVNFILITYIYIASFIRIDSVIFLIATVVYSIRPSIVLLFIAARAVWFDEKLNQLIKALRIWYQEIDYNTADQFENDEFYDALRKASSSSKSNPE